MKILLVNPKMASGWRPYVIPPIGLCSLKASIKEHEVKVVDMSGMKVEAVKEIVREFEPDIVGVTSFTEARHSALNILRLAKDENIGTVTLIGGAHATFTYEQILSNYDYVDIVFLGEGEESIVKFLSKERGIESKGTFGIAYRSRDKIKVKNSQFIGNLDELPYPDYSDLDLDKYVDVEGPCKGKPLGAIETSRGCPYNCAFCSSKSMWGNVRYKSVERVLNELEHLIDKYGYEMISMVDDIFTVNKKRTMEICDGILGRGIKIEWKCQTRTDRVGKELLELMKEAGCKLMAYGVESGSPKILKNLNKEEAKEDIKNAFKWTREVGMESVFNVIVGSPGETGETLSETKRLIEECKPDSIGYAALRAYPGSKIWKLGKEQGLFNENILLTNKESIHYTGSMTLPEMYRALVGFKMLGARLKGIRGWVELIKFALNVLSQTPRKVWEMLK